MDTLKHLFDNNREWAERIAAEDPDFFPKLAKQQKPELLWIGCADSRVPANEIINLPPGEVFVHRNIANMVIHTDLNCLSVIQFAVEILQIKHIIVCGHYGCSGIRAAMENQKNGMVDNWLRHIKDVVRFNADDLIHLPPNEKHDRLCELNVIEQVANVCNSHAVQRAWKNGNELHVHGWIYDVSNGILQEVQPGINNYEQLDDKYKNL